MDVADTSDDVAMLPRVPLVLDRALGVWIFHLMEREGRICCSGMLGMCSCCVAIGADVLVICSKNERQTYHGGAGKVLIIAW